MHYLKQEGKTCLLTSAAMVLDCEVQDLVDEIGHDGLAIIPEWEKAKYPELGVHPQEIIDCALRRNIAVVQIEALPRQAPQEGTFPFVATFNAHYAEKRLERYMNMYDGIIAGMNKNDNLHCIAWDCENQVAYDGAQDCIVSLDDFTIIYFFAFIKF